MKQIEEFLKQNSQALIGNQVFAEFLVIVQEILEQNKILGQENQQLRQQVQELRKEVQLLKDEIARLKKQPPRPKIEPSKLEKPINAKKNEKNWAKSSKTPRLVIDKTKKVEVSKEKLQPGAIFKGYKKVVTQNLTITKEVTCHLLEQWKNPDGTYVKASLPEGYNDGHFGPELRQYIIYQHYCNRVTQNRIKVDLADKGIDISSGQIEAILKGAAQLLKSEKEALIKAGLKAKYFQADDTGARHRGKNGYATVICNDFFTYIVSSEKKSRINFLEILLGTRIEYIITQETIDYLAPFEQPDFVIGRLQNSLGRRFDSATWASYLSENKFGKEACRLVTEGAMIGSLMEREILTPNTIIMSDGAGQFNLFTHILCWIHVERAIKKLVPANEKDREEIDFVLDEFWKLYRDLKAYKDCADTHSIELKQKLEAQFDELFNFRATEIPLANALKKIRDNKDQLLLVLKYPFVPLHNNASERDIREYVTIRKISGGTRSQLGREARDTFISLCKTCKKLSISFWHYLADRINGTNNILPLATIVAQKIGPPVIST